MSKEALLVSLSFFSYRRLVVCFLLAGRCTVVLGASVIMFREAYVCTDGAVKIVTCRPVTTEAKSPTLREYHIMRKSKYSINSSLS